MVLISLFTVKIPKLFSRKGNPKSPTLQETAKSGLDDQGENANGFGENNLTQPVGYFTYDKDWKVTGSGIKYPLTDKTTENVL